MPIVRTQGPIAYSGQLVAFSDPAQDNPYQERVIVDTAGVPVTFTDNKVEFTQTGTAGTSGQQQYTGV